MSKHNSVNGINCYLSEEIVDEHRDDIIHINDEIMKQLEGTGIDCVDFCDVSAGSIQVRLFHKDVPGYSYADVNLSYDWDNIEEVVQDAIEAFKRLDNPEHLSSYKRFIADGEKYGWD